MLPVEVDLHAEAALRPAIRVQKLEQLKLQATPAGRGTARPQSPLSAVPRYGLHNLVLDGLLVLHYCYYP